MTENISAIENTSAAEKPPENATVIGSSVLTQEIDRLSDGIIAAIKTVYDPEIPADIYELGLIYKIDIGEDQAVKIDMSLTSPNCPSAQELPIMAENAVASVPEREGGQGGNCLGPALGPEPDVGRGAFSVEYVVSHQGE